MSAVRPASDARGGFRYEASQFDGAIVLAAVGPLGCGPERRQQPEVGVRASRNRSLDGRPSGRLDTGRREVAVLTIQSRAVVAGGSRSVGM